MQFKGKKVLITGGSRGIGKAIAMRLAADGADIAIVGKTAEPHPKLEGTIYTAAEEIAKAGAGKVLPIQGDIRYEDSIEQIVKTHPEYLRLLNVKPGLTSLGMVKFGYAENVDEMIIRMKYDLTYIENPSLLLDIKIMLQSIKVVFAGKGK